MSGPAKKDIAFVIDKNGCFICTSHSVTGIGNHYYPCISHHSRRIRISRFIYKKCIGEIPNGKIVMHICDNTLCINPLHLRLGTSKDNSIDMVSKNRQANGERQGASKLTKDQVKEILNDRSSTCKKLGIKYNISASAINRIRLRRTWKHVRI